MYLHIPGSFVVEVWVYYSSRPIKQKQTMVKMMTTGADSSVLQHYQSSWPGSVTSIIGTCPTPLVVP